MKIEAKDITDKMLEAIDGDGHGMYDPKGYTDLGWPEEFVKENTRKEKSGTGKYQLYDNSGRPVKFIVGVYSLTFHRSVAHALGCPGSNKMGRGFEAQELAQQIHAKVKEARGEPVK